MTEPEKKDVKAETVIDVSAYETPPKDKDGNLIKGEDNKTVKGTLLGTDTTYEYSTDQKGLDAATKRYKIKSIVSDLNRQLKTDCRNAIASEAKRDADPEKKIKRDIAKTHKAISEERRAELNTELAALLNKYKDIEEA